MLALGCVSSYSRLKKNNTAGRGADQKQGRANEDGEDKKDWLISARAPESLAKERDEETIHEIVHYRANRDSCGRNICQYEHSLLCLGLAESDGLHRESHTQQAEYNCEGSKHEKRKSYSSADG